MLINMNWSSGTLVKLLESPLTWTVSELVDPRAAVRVMSFPLLPLRVLQVDGRNGLWCVRVELLGGVHSSEGGGNEPSVGLVEV